ncbi:MAG TPA: hypothetical protein DCY23_01925 [Ruminococcaceae bacterium]|nr:hypothetical protein [Oscillospiraceae bacterium]
MRKNFKRTLAVFCAALTALSVAVAGNLSLLKAAAEVSSAQGTSFGEDNAYLKLDNALESAPTSVEADVKMSSTVKDEWTLFDGSDYQTNVTDRVSTGKTEEGDAPGAGIGYVGMQLISKAVGSVWYNMPAIDISKYGKDELVLSFWVYSPNAGKLADRGRIRLSDTDDGYDGKAENNRQNLDFYLSDIKTASDGWNYIEMSLDKFKLDYTDTEREFSAIRCFKLHGAASNTEDTEKEIRIADVKLSVKKDATEWTLRDGGIATATKYEGKLTSDDITTYISGADDVNDGPGEGLEFEEFTSDNTKTFSNSGKFVTIDVSDYAKNELAVDFWCWSENAGSLFNGGVLIINNRTTGVADLAKGPYIQYNGNKITVKAGWNHINISLDKFIDMKKTVDGEPTDEGYDWSQPIKVFRFNGLKQGTEVTNKIRIGEVKLVANAENKVYTSDIDESVYNNGYSVFSNLNGSEGDTPYALFVTRDGNPAFIYNDKMFVLNHNICNGEFVKLGVTVNDNGTVTFKVGDDIEATSTGTVTVPEAPKFTACHSIGADAAGGALMNGSIKDLVIKNGENAVSWTLSSNKAYPLNAVKASDGTNNAHFAGIENINDSVVVYYDNAAAGNLPKNTADMDGYVFAGWFTDEDCTVPLTGTGAAYAKYVDKNVLTVKAQVNKDNNADIRFVTTVDSLDYKLVGFEIVFCNEMASLEKTKTTTVYQSLNQFVDGNNTPVSPTVFSPASNFFAAFTVRNVPSDKTSEKFTVRAYWVTLDGTPVYGESAQRSIAA